MFNVNNRIEDGMARRPAQSFEDLIVWQKGHRLVLRVYRETATFPMHELYGLVSQMRRAAVSVSANIAEGFSRRGRPDKARIMNIAQASLAELKYNFLLARDLEYLKPIERWDDVEEVGRMLGAYAQTLLTPSS